MMAFKDWFDHVETFFGREYAIIRTDIGPLDTYAGLLSIYIHDPQTGHIERYMAPASMPEADRAIFDPDIHDNEFADMKANGEWDDVSQPDLLAWPRLIGDITGDPRFGTVINRMLDAMRDVQPRTSSHGSELQ